MKVCSMCKVEKELSEFHKRRGTPDGLKYACKTCSNGYGRQYRKENPEKVKEHGRQWREANPEYDRQYRAENSETLKEYSRQYYRENSEARNEYSRQYHRDNLESRIEYSRQWREENSEKIRAGIAVRASIRAGRMKPAKECICEDCGKAAAHYHHESYTEEHRLDVIPLCRSCHMRRHRSL